MTTVASVFVGCKVSQADGEQALAELEAAGLRPAARQEEADVVVVHTCCVTAEAERKSRRLARRYSRLGRRVIVAGCAARLRPEQFDEPGLEISAAPDWAALAQTVNVAEAVPVAHASEDDPGASSDGLGTPTPSASGETARGARTRLILKVQDGCSGRCSYCAIRLVRGEPRSTPLEEAIAAARRGVSSGCGEVVVSGIDLGAWRDAGLRLPDLIEALVTLPGLRRLRLSSLEPRHVDERLLAALAHPLVARHVHLPLQSADDGVLAAMNRPYSVREYMAIADRVRARLGEGMLSTDVIVGFPAEDEAAFSRTLTVLGAGLFGRVHVFAYSPRPGTAAAALPPLPAAVVAERMERALAAAAQAAAAARRAALGRPAEVLIEDRRDGLWRGYSSEYVYYSLRGSARRGELVHAVAEHEHKDGVMGTVKETCS
jgi:threonylcarbamoyladenosine tRNA methylthiotransferase MtaB